MKQYRTHTVLNTQSETEEIYITLYILYVSIYKYNNEHFQTKKTVHDHQGGLATAFNRIGLFVRSLVISLFFFLLYFVRLLLLKVFFYSMLCVQFSCCI